jgi:hypothetical protein
MLYNRYWENQNQMSQIKDGTAPTNMVGAE